MKKTTWKPMAALLLGLWVTGFGRVVAVERERPMIQLAILLDTSNSMDGLIDQARTQLWKIVNELATARRGGVAPRLEVGLYEYGNDSLASGEGYIRQVSGLTRDLDLISERLFALKTNGGSEFCGHVIRDALQGLGWSRESRDLKLIFIAGNEPFTQGRVDFREACKAAIGKGIVVNTIFCGGREEGIRGLWKEGADLADGRYMAIDQSRVVPDIRAPQDAEIAQLNAELNRTYIAYGARGGESKKRQEAQDMNAAPNPTVAAQRVAAKATAQYENSSWDLVDAKVVGGVRVESIKDDELPAEMRRMSPAERNAYVDKMARQRAEIQARIQKLVKAREGHVAAEMKKLAGGDTLDEAVLGAVREQARRKNYVFEK